MIVVTPAEPVHAEGIVALAEEMDRFYGATDVDPLEVRLRQINDAIFAPQPTANALLAWDGGRLVGLAAYSFLWPAVGLTRSLFLKELYVVESARRSGVGEQLMRAVFAIAVKHDCSRVEWQTESTNADARAFYAKIGAPEFGGKVSYRVDDELLQRLTGTDSDSFG
ncbi:GNAT family N-acetyltransferase [Actinoplanes sp. NBC_00393]|uniref:GNAT family N-acetyltransferase n=1 Tax=Actinoplanes sp. NBC_00393 TaxID=2975953 RepID=UPI002E20FC12